MEESILLERMLVKAARKSAPSAPAAALADIYGLIARDESPLSAARVL